MKKRLAIILVLIMCLQLSACSSGMAGEDGNAGTDKAGTEIEEQTDEDIDVIEETGEMSEGNRKMIAEALGVEESSRSIRFFLNTLETLNAGEIKSAEAGTDGNDRYVDVLAEDDTAYRIYLTGSGSVDAVKNLTTGEWPIKSER